MSDPSDPSSDKLLRVGVEVGVDSEGSTSSSRSSTPHREDAPQDQAPRSATGSRIMSECEAVPGLSTARPVKAETFCECLRLGKEKECTCGEDDHYFEWMWDDLSKSSAAMLRDDKREVIFHTDYSCGTAAVRGSEPMKDDQYFWEVKMTTPVYGTDMMVGVGTDHTNLDKYKHVFCSLIGRDAESWGLSYSGVLHHKGRKLLYASKFGQGSIIGVHLDMWHGMLSFYKNRKPLGVAFRGLQGKIMFPMVSSTAARSGMKVVTSRSFRTSLQFMCCQVLRKLVPKHLNVLDTVLLPPGLIAFLENNMGWLLQSCFVQQASTRSAQKQPLSEVGEKRPLSEVGEKRPLSEVGEKRPLSEVGEKRSLSEVDEKRPCSEVGEKRPLSEVGEIQSLSEVGEKRPLSEVGEKRPLSEVGEKRPLSEVGEKRPLSEVGKKRPLSEVEGDLTKPSSPKRVRQEASTSQS